MADASRKRSVALLGVALMALLPNCVGTEADAPSVHEGPCGPAAGFTNTTYSFSASATDPGGDSVSIRCSWGDGDTSNWSAFVPSGGRVELAHQWTTPHYYTLTAQARNTAQRASAWSEGCGVRVVTPVAVYSEGFENYPDSSYPLHGWFRLWTGGDAHLTTECAHTGTKSFVLAGIPPYPAVRADGLELNLTRVHLLRYELHVMVADSAAGNALVGFFEFVTRAENRDWNAVCFDYERGRVVVKGTGWTVTDFVWGTGRWYSVRVDIDYRNLRLSAWVNDTLVASNLAAASRGVTDTFALSNYYSGKVYFDDVVITTAGFR